jgi:hypothetical protein
VIVRGRHIVQREILEPGPSPDKCYLSAGLLYTVPKPTLSCSLLSNYYSTVHYDEIDY